MKNLRRRRQTVFAATVFLLGVGTTITYAVLPATDVPPAAVPVGTLAGKTSLNVLSVDAFTRAINQAHGSNGVLQHGHFAPGQSTGWHTHPGPNIVLVVGGSFTLIDEHCIETQYGIGQGFATGLEPHEAIAGPEGADYYGFYLLPANADVLRVDAAAPTCARR
jgi:quercetin dioxygenase-like cupin family protein